MGGWGSLWGDPGFFLERQNERGSQRGLSNGDSRRGLREGDTGRGTEREAHREGLKEEIQGGGHRKGA